MFGSFELLVVGVLLIYGVRRLSHSLHRRGWIQWKMRRGTSSSLGNAVLGVQGIFEPPVRDVIEARSEEHAEDRESGDPPHPGSGKRVIR